MLTHLTLVSWFSGVIGFTRQHLHAVPTPFQDSFELVVRETVLKTKVDLKRERVSLNSSIRELT